MDNANLPYYRAFSLNNHDKRHLGDGIYAQIKDDAIALSCENGTEIRPVRLSPITERICQALDALPKETAT